MTRPIDSRFRWQQTRRALDDVAAGRVLPAKTVYAWLRSWGTPGELKPPVLRQPKKANT